MAKAILVCGKICSGKSRYAQRLREKGRAVVLSCDEITLALFEGDLGESHDKIVKRTKNYLYQKSLEIIDVGSDVILDWGFWTKYERDFASDFYRSRGISCELHYIDISDDVWKINLHERNSAVANGEIKAYFADEGLIKKFNEIFEPPERSEINIWYNNDRI